MSVRAFDYEKTPVGGVNATQKKQKRQADALLKSAGIRGLDFIGLRTDCQHQRAQCQTYANVADVTS
jgi:hypothetical protein